jgi:hypothetical protein
MTAGTPFVRVRLWRPATFFPPDGASDDPDFEDAVRLTAYFLWEQAGKPLGQEQIYWQRAREQHLRQRAYDLWLADGGPQGEAERYWFEAERQPKS